MTAIIIERETNKTMTYKIKGHEAERISYINNEVVHYFITEKNEYFSVSTKDYYVAIQV